MKEFNKIRLGHAEVEIPTSKYKQIISERIRYNIMSQSELMEAINIYQIDGREDIIQKWDIENKEEALKELETYSCQITKRNGYYSIEVYYLEEYAEDEEGDFDEGSNYDFAITEWGNWSDAENEAARKLYDYMSFPQDSIISDIEHDYLTLNNYGGCDFLHYLDAWREAIISVSTGKITEDAEEIENIVNS